MRTLEDATRLYLQHCEDNELTSTLPTVTSLRDKRGQWTLCDSAGSVIARVFPSGKVMTAEVTEQLRETLRRALAAVDLVEDSGDIGIISSELRGLAPCRDEFTDGLNGEWINDELQTALGAQITVS